MKLVDTVTRETTYLVLADPQSASGKAEKARKLGTQVISEEALIGLVGGAVEAGGAAQAGGAAEAGAQRLNR
jgi:BRCT domain type II-containing protein